MQIRYSVYRYRSGELVLFECRGYDDNGILVEISGTLIYRVPPAGGWVDLGKICDDHGKVFKAAEARCEALNETKRAAHYAAWYRARPEIQVAGKPWWVE